MLLVLFNDDVARRCSLPFIAFQVNITMLDETFTNKNIKGFTLIELMIVVAIVGILSAIAVPMYEDYINKTRVLEAITQLKGLQTELEIYWSTHGEYPDEVRKIPVAGYDTTVTDNVRNLHYNHDGAGGKVWVSASLNPATMIGGEAGGDGDRSMTIHIGGVPVNGELKFICGIWAQGDIHSKNVDPAWLPEGCNEPNVGAKLDELVSP